MKRPLLTLTVIPSFTGGVIIELFENRVRNTSAYMLSYKRSVHPLTSVGDIRIDEYDLAESWEREAPANESERVKGLLKKISVPAIATYALGVDATMYMLSVVNGMNEVRFRWWHKAPEGWEEIGQVADRLLGLAEELADGRNV